MLVSRQNESREIPHHTSSKSLQRQRGMRLGIFIAVIALALVLRLHFATQVPTIVIPTPTLPAVNAFDTFNDAGALLKDDKIIGAALKWKGEPEKVTPEQKSLLVRENQAVLAKLRLGLTQEYHNPPIRSIKEQLPYYAQFRSLARLLALEGQIQSAQGNWNGTMESSLDAIQMGEMVPHGSPLVGGLAGVAMQAIGRREVFQVVPQLSASQARAALQRLQSIEQQHIRFADWVQEEKWTTQAELQEIFRGNLYQSVKDRVFVEGETAFDENVKSTVGELLYVVWSKKTIMANITSYMDKNIAIACQPYARHLPEPPIPSDPISNIMVPAFMQTRVKEVASATQNALLQATLALRVYQAEHGRFPDTLNTLVPGILPRLPDDPFAINAPLRYHRTANGYCLYSIGPDSRDDGGKPIDDPKRVTGTNKKARYYVHEDSTGDIVAGINIY